MGTKFVVASGRQYYSLLSDFQEHTKDVVLCSENGAFIVDDGQELYAGCMTKEQVKMSLDAAYAVEGIEPVVCAKYVTYTTSQGMADFLGSPKFNYKMAVVDDLYNIDDDIIKISMAVMNGVLLPSF